MKAFSSDKAISAHSYLCLESQTSVSFLDCLIPLNWVIFKMVKSLKQAVIVIFGVFQSLSYSPSVDLLY